MLDEDEHYRSKGFVVGPGVFVSDVPLFDEVLRVVVEERCSDTDTARRMNAETNMNRHRPNLEIQGLTPDMGRGDEIVIARHGYVA